jgi:microcystin-dependent protein
MNGVIGYTTLFAGTFAPNNWAFCNGQVLSISQYTALFSILGTTYGGNGTTNFSLPNLQGRAVVGVGQGISVYTLGESGGSETNILSTSQLPSHTHPLQITIAPLTSGTTNSSTPASAVYATGNNSLYNFSGNTPMQSFASILSMMSAGSNTPAPVPTLHPVLGLNYIICLNGQLPPRS